MSRILLLLNLGVIFLITLSGDYPLLAQISATSPSLTTFSENNINQLARSTTVRIFAPNISGSGVLLHREGRTYTILTNWHVVASKPQTVMAPDAQKYNLFGIRQLGNYDLAIAYFESDTSYQIAPIKQGAIALGEKVFAAGFPMYEQSGVTTFDKGLQPFYLTQGIVSLLPSKSLPQGYRLGYTNDIKVGMSGGPIFNYQGQLIGINGRVKYRDPGFGVYIFEDGTEPSDVLLEQMIQSSWGIPITTYLSYVHANLNSMTDSNNLIR